MKSKLLPEEYWLYRGVVGKVTGQDRIIIPVSYREQLKFEDTSKVECFLTVDNELVIKAYDSERNPERRGLRGVIRTISGLGQLNIPREYKTALNLKKNDLVEMVMTTENEIIIKKYEEN